MNWSVYLRLIRFDKPAGTMLLWAPTAWALWLAKPGFPGLNYSILFFIGTFCMRSAGCIVNDITDRRIDLQVKRTKNRPLTTAELSLNSALSLMFVLLLAALIILILLPPACFYYALLALLITIIYPFCKRFIHAPQIVLGLAFSMGIPMAYAALSAAPDLIMLLLIAINWLWTVAYDTQYALADREDDLRIGVKSTAVLFADYSPLIIGLLQLVAHALWIPLAVMAGLSAVFYIGWGCGAIIFLAQRNCLKTTNLKNCARVFYLNALYGVLCWLMIIWSIH